MAKFTVTITEAEEKALLAVMVDIQEWLDNSIHNRARKATDKIIQDCTDRQPKKIPAGEKEAIILQTDFETAEERGKRVIPQTE